MLSIIPIKILSLFHYCLQIAGVIIFSCHGFCFAQEAPPLSNVTLNLKDNIRYTLTTDELEVLKNQSPTFEDMFNHCGSDEKQSISLPIDLSQPQLIDALNYCKIIKSSTSELTTIINYLERKALSLFKIDQVLDFKQKDSLRSALLSLVLEGNIFPFSSFSSLSEHEKKVLFEELKKASPNNLLKHISAQEVPLNISDMCLSPCGTYVALCDNYKQVTVFNTQSCKKIADLEPKYYFFYRHMQFIPLSNNLLILGSEHLYLLDYVNNKSSLYCKNNPPSFYLAHTKEGTFGLNPYWGTIAKYGERLKKPIAKNKFQINIDEEESPLSFTEQNGELCFISCYLSNTNNFLKKRIFKKEDLQLIKIEENIPSALALYPVFQDKKIKSHDQNSVGFFPGTTTPFLKALSTMLYRKEHALDIFFKNAVLYNKEDIFNLIIDQKITYTFKLSSRKSDTGDFEINYLLNQDRTKLCFINTHDHLLHCCDTSKMKQFVMLHSAKTWQEYIQELSTMGTIYYPLYKKFIDLTKKRNVHCKGLYVGTPRIFLESIDQRPMTFYQKIPTIIVNKEPPQALFGLLADRKILSQYFFWKKLTIRP